MCLFLFIKGLQVANIDAEYGKNGLYFSYALHILFYLNMSGGSLSLLCFLQSVQLKS